MTAPRDGITRRPLRPESPACYPVSRFFHTSMCFQDWPGLLLSQRAPSTARAPHDQVAALAAGPVRTTGPAQHPDGWPGGTLRRLLLRDLCLITFMKIIVIDGIQYNGTNRQEASALLID